MGKIKAPWFQRILTVTKKEFIHIRRDKPSLVISFLMPIMMLMIFGFAVNTDVNNVGMAVYDQSSSELSKELVDGYAQTDYFSFYAYASSVAELESLIELGDVSVGLIIPEDYAKDLKRNEQTQVQILLDGSDPTIARTAASYSVAIANAYSANYTIEELNRMGGGIDLGGISAVPMFMYNPTLESAKFNIPGVVGLILQNITIILTALAMVREKELGTMEQLIMTPVTSIELIIGKLIPYVVIGLYDFAIVMVLSYTVFGVTVAGSIVELIVLGIIFLIGSLAMGMLISTVAKNQAQAIQGTLAFLLPSVLLSGFMFPREAMPMPIQFLSNLIPITHFLIILRGIMVKGVSSFQMMEATLSMLGLLGLLILVTAFKFSKKLD